MFSSKSFIFRSLTHFEFTFVYGVREYSNFILLHVAVKFSKHILLKRLSFLLCIFLLPLLKIRCPQVPGFIPGFSIFFHSIFLVLCQYHPVLITVALQYSLKSRRLIPPALFFFLKIALAIQGLSYFHTNCGIFFLLVL